MGAEGLTQLYDRTLPKEVNRILNRFQGRCEPIGVYVPTNFSIERTETGYDVYSDKGELLGSAPTLDEARQHFPDMGHEALDEVHGVKMNEAMRKAILATGFPAWG